MARIVGGCLSQFHNEPDSFELLLSYADGKEIGHVIDRADAAKLTESMAQELGLENVAINASMLATLMHLRDAIAPDHVTLKGHTDFKAGAVEVINLAISRATPVPQAVMQSEAAEENIYELRKEGEWVRVTKKEWIEAERSAGFRPKLSSGHELYMKTCATSGFSGNNIEGRITVPTS